MKIGIVGSGYVGLVTGACLADLGHQVLCMDDNQEKIALLQSGKIPIYEPGLQELIRTNTEEGRLSFTHGMKEAVEASELLFICVGTPPKPSGEADLSAVEAVGRRIGQYINGHKLIVEKSTVPVQTARWLQKTIHSVLESNREFEIASNPEFLREGSAIHDFLHPDRIVLGVSSRTAASLLVELFEPLNAPLLITDIESAELIKHASNAFLAMKISFVNAVAQICDKTGADIKKVAKGIGLDDRIGTAFLDAGIGYGGACFPKDLDAFIHLAEKIGVDFKLLKAVREINDQQRSLPVEKIGSALGDLQGRTLGIWGLTFKPQTDDLRGAVSIEMISTLLKAQARIRVYDPVAMENVRKQFPSLSHEMSEPNRPLASGLRANALDSAKALYYAKDAYDAARGCEALILATDWPVFRQLNFSLVKKSMKRPLFFDGRNLLDPTRMAELGFEYYGVGRNSVGTHR